MNALSQQKSALPSSAQQIALTPTQREAANDALDFVQKARGTSEEFIISGLAGTGKTTTMATFLGELKASGVRAAVCTPTGKAAFVINSKQKHFLAQTIHKALTKRPFDALAKIHNELDALEELSRTRDLTPEEVEKEAKLLKQLDAEKAVGDNLSFEPADPDEIYGQYDCLVFDEASMIGKSKTYDRLISHLEIPRLYFGDGGQLPPVKDTPAVNFRLANHKLTQILRQGADSGILQFAHRVNKGAMMTVAEINKYPDLSVIKSSHTSSVRQFAADHQFIVWTNKERHALNELTRPIRGFDVSGIADEHKCRPLVGEQIMVSENNETYRLLRGQLLNVTAVTEHPRLTNNPYICYIVCNDDQGRERSMPISLTDMTPKPLFKNETQDKKMRWIADKNGVDMRFPYCVTAHTAQGSEWDKVCVLASMMPEGHRDWKTWWYTAVTRAKNELVLASHYFSHDPSS